MSTIALRGLHPRRTVFSRWTLAYPLEMHGFGEVKVQQLKLNWLSCMVRHLPKELTRQFKVKILADTASGTKEFINGIRKLKYHAIVSVGCNRKLIDGRLIKHLYHRGQQVRLVGLDLTVTISWYYFKTDKGVFLKRYVISTTPLKASTISWWGKDETCPYYYLILNAFDL